MVWTIRKFDDETAFVIEDSGNLVGRIIEHEGTWMVRFPDAPAFDWTCSTAPETGGADRAIGYARGIERAVEVNARETRQQGGSFQIATGVHSKRRASR